MIIIRPGKRKFIRACREKLFEVTCNWCGAVLEMQEGELINRRYNYRFSCPYCGKYHSDYTTKFLREELMDTRDVVFLDSIRNPSWETTEEELHDARFRETRERIGVDDCTYLSTPETDSNA
jgi:hypothetical protein